MSLVLGMIVNANCLFRNMPFTRLHVGFLFEYLPIRDCYVDVYWLQMVLNDFLSAQPMAYQLEQLVYKSDVKRSIETWCEVVSREKFSPSCETCGLLCQLPHFWTNQ